MKTGTKAKEDIGKRIAALRDEKGVTQLEMAKALNVLRQVVTHWENGTRDIKSRDMVAIADYLGVSCDKLLRGVEADNLEVHSQLGLEDRAIKNLKKIVEADSKNGPEHEQALTVLNDIISSKAFGELTFAAAAFRWADNKSKEALLEEEQGDLPPNAKATERAYIQVVEKISSFMLDVSDTSKVNGILESVTPFLSMYHTESNSKKAMDRLFAKALNG